MKIIYNNIIPFPGFVAINLFGVLFARKEYKDKLTNSISYKSRVINHEEIHTAQIKELWYIGFYIMYLYYYIKNFFKYPLGKQYINIPFEKEAYTNERNLNYLNERNKNSWKKYK